MVSAAFPGEELSVELEGAGRTRLWGTLPSGWVASMDERFDRLAWHDLGVALGRYAVEKPWKYGVEILRLMAEGELPDLADWSCTSCERAFAGRDQAMEHDCATA